jgi:hypothetical protein
MAWWNFCSMGKSPDMMFFSGSAGQLAEKAMVVSGRF